MAIVYSGGGGTSTSTINISGLTETLATLKTSLASNTGYGTVSNNVITFNATLIITSNGISGTAAFTASNCTLYFPSTYTFRVPNIAGETNTTTNLTDVEIIFDGSAKSYYNAINYGIHNWTRVVYRNQGAGRTDLFTNNGETFNFNNVQLTVNGTGDFIHLYGASNVTYQGISVTGLGSTEAFELGANGGTTTIAQSLTLAGSGITTMTINNGAASYSGTVDLRSLTWAGSNNWATNYGTGVGTTYYTNPNKPTTFSGYLITVLYNGGVYNFAERYTHDVTAVNSSAVGISGVSVGDYRSGAFVWTATTNASGVITEQYVSTVTGAGTATSNNYVVPLTTSSNTVQVAAWLYGYVSAVGSRTFTPAGTGITDTLLMVADQTTLTQSGAAALTAVSTLDNLYDTSRYWNTLNTTNIQLPSLGTPIVSTNGTQLNLGSYNLVIASGNTTAGNAFSVTGTTITVHAGTLAAGTKFTSFVTTGSTTVNAGVTVSANFITNTLVNSGTLTGQYTVGGNSSGILTFTNLATGTTGIYITPNNGQATQYFTVNGTSQTIYIAPNTGATAGTYKIAQYGYLPLAGSFSSNAVTSITAVQTADTGISQPISNILTVSGYTTLNSPDQVYDYAAYWESTLSGITSTRATSAVGTQLSFGSANVTFNTGATYTYSITNGNPTIKSAASFIPGSISYTSFATTSGVVLTGLTYGTSLTCPYTSNSGSTTVFTMTNIPGNSSIAISNTAGTLQQYINPASGTQTVYVGLQASTAIWNWKVASYDYFPQTGVFTVGSNGSYYPSSIVSLGTDTGITQTSVATVSGYASLSSPDRIYDYAAYWETTQSGITSTRVTTDVGVQLSFGTTSVTLNPSATYTYTISGGNPIIKSAASFVPGTSFTSMVTSSGMALTGLSYGTTMTCPYTCNSGSTTVFTLTALISGSSVLITNNSGATQQYFAGVSGTQYIYVPVLASSASWNWKVANYGYIAETGVFTAGSSTNFYPTSPVSLGTDTGITQTNINTVSGYTIFNSLDNIYDYLAYWETTSGIGATPYGIQVARPATKNGNSISFGSNNVTFRYGPYGLYAYTPGTPNSLSFKVPLTISGGTTFTQINTTGTVNFIGVSVPTPTFIYTSNLGTSAVLTLTNLPSNSYVYIQNAAGVQQVIASGQSSSYSYSTAPGASSGNWAWSTKAVGYTSAAGTYAPSAGGLTSISVSCPQLIQSTGAIMYQGSTNSLCTVSFTTDPGYADILIGNGQVTVQNVFDISENALVTSSGLAWLANGFSNNQIFLAPTGNFLFLSHDWRLKALNTTSPNAQVLGFPLSTDGTPINSANGNILIFSTTQATDTATAVWNAIASTYSTAGTMGEQVNLTQAAAALAAALSA